MSAWIAHALCRVGARLPGARTGAGRRRDDAKGVAAAAGAARGAFGVAADADFGASRYETLAHELHDSVAQQLGFVSLEAFKLESLLGQPELAAATLAEMRQVLGRVQKQVRELIAGSRQSMLDRSLREALADSVAELSRRGGVVFELDNRLPDGLLAPGCELQLQQIVREAMANVVQHSHARSARIELLASAGEGLLATIQDDGVGIDPQGGREGHYGIAIMRERARTLGAVLSIEATQPCGTRVALRVPAQRLARMRPR